MPKSNPTSWRTNKIISLQDATAVAANLKANGQKIVTVNGSFDLLHPGHIDQLEQAKQQGDVLFVGINSDHSIQEQKGKTRPIIPENARAAMLAALACVDYVTIIDAHYDALPAQFLQAVKPNVHVNGPDYGKPAGWIEWPVMQEVGAAGFLAKKRNDFSTTELINKIIMVEELKTKNEKRKTTT